MTDQHEDPHHHTRRDAETSIALGIFMSVLAVAVLIGTFFAEQANARVVNAISGLVLGVIAGGFVWRGISVKRKL